MIQEGGVDRAWLAAIAYGDLTASQAADAAARLAAKDIPTPETQAAKRALKLARDAERASDEAKIAATLRLIRGLPDNPPDAVLPAAETVAARTAAAIRLIRGQK
jgi:hypothetical protein